MHALLLVIYEALDLYKWVVIGAAVLSWLIAFNVVNIRNDLVRSIWNVLDALTTPLLRPIRNFLPNLGGIDISPIILLLAISFVQYLIGDLLRAYPYAF
jgi:YggT family protein